MTELDSLIQNGAGSNIPAPEGPFAAEPRPDAVPEMFDAGSLWNVEYNLRPYAKAQGHVPPPSQEQLDRYIMRTSVLDVEIDHLARTAIRPYNRLGDEAEQAAYHLQKAKEEHDEEKIEKWRSELERLEESVRLSEESMQEAIQKKRELLSQIKDEVAAFCSDKPTRAQLEKLPENVFVPFRNYLRRHLDPNG